MKSTIIWLPTAGTQPPNCYPVLMLLDGCVFVGWYGTKDKEWRINNSYSAVPQWWAPLPRIEECEA